MFSTRRLFAISALMSIAYFSNVASAALLAHYAAEGNFLDSSGNNRTATVNGNVAFRAGIGQAFDLDNLVNTLNAPNYLTVPSLSGGNVSALAGTGFTVAAWFSEDTFGNGGSILNLRSVGNDSGFLIEPAFGVPNSLSVGVYTSNGLQLLQVPNFTVGELHHIAMVFDPAQQIFAIYRDGQLATSMGIAMNFMRLDNDETFMIGRNAVNTIGFDGLIDEVRIYNTPLSADDIRHLAVPEVGSSLMLASAGTIALGLQWLKRRNSRRLEI
jgi:hypothetical protein